MYEPFKSVVQCRLIFPRGLFGLRAAHLNQKVVFIGGVVDGGNFRREVLYGILLPADGISGFCLQVLQFNVEARTWSEIEPLKEERYGHAIAEVNFDAVGCVSVSVSTA